MKWQEEWLGQSKHMRHKLWQNGNVQFIVFPNVAAGKVTAWRVFQVCFHQGDRVQGVFPTLEEAKRVAELALIDQELDK